MHIDGHAAIDHDLRHADGQPLLPAACALALMPRPALQHAPTALQHLMSRESPISDVFDECEECARLRATETATQAVRITVAHAFVLCIRAW